ncbi:hypothetical protein QTI24_18300 [Variovorax sp. J22P240]|uniref:hypothetical protein n=1 Tax=Variovorax sp. J22P240 TaxID=3053514 RepID=UPI002578C104|nr:hypothetical protein [Variovorax sp. J22P240]MDM0000577.1 hypothetical protein [Variovorax sp. J22P240]
MKATSSFVLPSARLFHRSGIASAVVIALALAGCGGGGGSSFPVTGQPAAQGGGPDAGPGTQQASAGIISGTAAAGLPLRGTVTVRDAKGATKTVPLSSIGGYSVDVTGMTGPFLFIAQGTAGSSQYTLVSAATSADVNGNINITPFTDLVVANIAGQLASKFFESGDYSALTKEALDSELSGLKAKLLPALLALGVDASVDLLRTAFTPLASALDTALDVLRVSVDPASNVATIRNLVTQQQLADDLATRAAAETGVAPMDGAGMASAGDDISQVRKVFADFSSRFADGAPVAAALRPLLTDDFLFQDMDAAEFSAEVAADPNLVGGSFTDVTPVGFEPGKSSVLVDFTHRDKDGVAFSRQQNVRVAKGSDGVWRLAGDGHAMELEIHPLARSWGNGTCGGTGFDVIIKDHHAGNSGAVAGVIVTGPGFPQAGVKYVPAVRDLAWYWVDPALPQMPNPGYQMQGNCIGLIDEQKEAVIKAIPDNAVYVFKAVDASGQPVQYNGAAMVYTLRVPRRPLTMTEALALRPPVMTPSVPFTDYKGGPLTLSVAGVNPGFSTHLVLGIADAMYQTSYSDEVDVAPRRDGTASHAFTLPTISSSVWQNYSVTTTDADWRQIVVTGLSGSLATP